VRNRAPAERKTDPSTIDPSGFPHALQHIQFGALCLRPARVVITAKLRSQRKAEGTGHRVTSCMMGALGYLHFHPFLAIHFNSVLVRAYIPFLNAVACYYLCSALPRRFIPGRYRDSICIARQWITRISSLLPLQCIS
jgi:hypothetical protein